jgi:hypothetical protein
MPYDKFKYFLNTEVKYRVFEAGIVKVFVGTITAKSMSINYWASNKKEQYSIRRKDVNSPIERWDTDYMINVDDIVGEH